MIDSMVARMERSNAAATNIAGCCHALIMGADAPGDHPGLKALMRKWASAELRAYACMIDAMVGDDGFRERNLKFISQKSIDKSNAASVKMASRARRLADAIEDHDTEFADEFLEAVKRDLAGEQKGSGQRPDDDDQNRKNDRPEIEVPR